MDIATVPQPSVLQPESRSCEQVETSTVPRSSSLPRPDHRSQEKHRTAVGCVRVSRSGFARRQGGSLWRRRLSGRKLNSPLRPPKLLDNNQPVPNIISA